MLLAFLILIFGLIETSFSQVNLIENGDFQKTNYKHPSGTVLRRIDTLFAHPSSWKSISTDGVPTLSFDSNISKLKFRHIEDQKACIIMQKKVPKGTILAAIRTTKKSKENPFSREYIIGKLTTPLEKGKVYNIGLSFYFSNLSCVGMDKIGVKLLDEYPNVYNLSPREDTSAIQLPLSQDIYTWTETSSQFIATGQEKYIMIGCFLEEKELKLYNKKRKWKVKCPDNNGQVISIGNIEIYTENDTLKAPNSLYPKGK